MGPPPFGGGNGVQDGLAQGITGLLQWSHRPSVMDMNNAVGEGPIWILLQWGHRLSVMDIPRCSADNRGSGSPLQWGHRLPVMDIADANKRHQTLVLLQWGHRLPAMDICSP